MSDANLLLVALFHKLLSENDYDALLALFTEDGQWIVPGTIRIPWSGIYATPKGRVMMILNRGLQLEREEFDIDRVFADDDCGAAFGSATLKGKVTGRSSQFQWSSRIDFVNGKVARYEEFIDTDRLSILLDPQR
jgi:ketosteroid isomerase-like protein